MEIKGFVTEITNKNNGYHTVAIFDTKQEGVNYLEKFLREDWQEYDYQSKDYMIDCLHTDGVVDAHGLYMSVNPSRSLSVEEQRTGRIINNNSPKIVALDGIEKIIDVLKENGVSFPEIGKALDNAVNISKIKLGQEHLKGQGR